MHNFIPHLKYLFGIAVLSFISSQVHAVVPTTERNALIAFQTITVTAATATNVPPVASFTATPPTGNASLTVAVDASGSIDSDGTIAVYEWSTSNGLNANSKTAIFTFTTVGSYTITLTVRNADYIKSETYSFPSW